MRKRLQYAHSVSQLCNNPETLPEKVSRGSAVMMEMRRPSSTTRFRLDDESALQVGVCPSFLLYLKILNTRYINRFHSLDLLIASRKFLPVLNRTATSNVNKIQGIHEGLKKKKTLSSANFITKRTTKNRSL